MVAQHYSYTSATRTRAQRKSWHCTGTAVWSCVKSHWDSPLFCDPLYEDFVISLHIPGSVQCVRVCVNKKAIT